MDPSLGAQGKEGERFMTTRMSVGFFRVGRALGRVEGLINIAGRCKRSGGSSIMDLPHPRGNYGIVELKRLSGGGIVGPKEEASSTGKRIFFNDAD